MILQLKLIKYFFIIGLFLILPATSSAATLSFKTKSWEIQPVTNNYVPHLSTRNDFDLKNMSRDIILGQTAHPAAVLLAPSTIEQILKLPNEINQSATEAQLVIEKNRAVKFSAGQNGQSLDLYSLRGLLLNNQDGALPVLIAEPAVSLKETNTLGINELVATGESDFAGSPKNRIHNVTIGANKFDGIIVAPGEEFSFNKYLGDVDAEHGFLPELVIKPQGVTPEFGGGLCQVSSTTFRAAMNAGLPITQRRNHSFAVQYYAPQGTDATIYPGSADLKFINDLSSSLLIHTRIVGRKLYFEFYGTKDNRVVAFEGPTQYDKKPDGSMKAIWTKHVTQNGETKTQVFKSTYLPPALFHPVATEQPTTPNPESPIPDPTTINPTP